MQSLLLTLSYVGILYVRQETRPTNTVYRDDVDVVKARLGAISLLTLAVVVFYGFQGEVLGLTITYNSIVDTSKALCLTAILFAAQVYETVVYTHNWGQALSDIWNIYGLRNYIIGPITEEIVFRACLITSLDDTWSPTKTIFITPLYFGVAHLHHAYEEYLREGKEHLTDILLTSTFQFLFTTIFGWYAAYLYIHFNTAYAPIAVHIFCNFMGVPEWPNGRIYRSLLFIGLASFFYLLTLV
jgi:prenyl protein peptidase